MEKDIWDVLYEKACSVQDDRQISPFIEAGSVASAILTKSGNIYVGVCIDTASTLGMCAERNAIANMITNGESEIDKIVAVMWDGSVGSPCGACREYMMQLDKNSGEIEVLLDLESKKTIRLKELIPDWWGKSSFEGMNTHTNTRDKTEQNLINKKEEMDENKVRVIKIGKEAIFEFLYEKFIEYVDDFLDVDAVDVGNSFAIDWERGEFIFCSYKSEDTEGNFISLPEEIDLQRVMENVDETTSTMFSDGRYIEYTKDEMIKLSKQ